MKLGVVTTSYPRAPGDPAGSFVAAHVDALRALGHDVEVIAAGTPTSSGAESGAASGESPSNGSRSPGAASRESPSNGSRSPGAASRESPLSGSRSPAVPVTWIASSLFDHGGAPDRLERHPLRSLAAAALVSARMTVAVARRAARWDSIIAHWLVPSAIAALPARIPLLAIAHGGDIHTLRRMHLLAPVLRALYRRDAQLAFVSEPLRAIARDAAPELAAWLDVATIQPMGLDLARFRRVGHTPTHPPTIVIAARLVDIKGVDVAIDALAHLRAPVRLVIAGDGPERSRLEARARERHASGASDTRANGRSSSAAASGASDTHANGRSSSAHGRSSSAHGRGADTLSSGGAGHAAHSIVFLGSVDTMQRDRLLREASVVVVPSRVTPSGRTEVGSPGTELEFAL